ncbi:MAG TPA: D-alanyl-D-alanine carboxypeptidase/D-alanyl-D-alanine-endopeptidase [Gemmatimonadaceae bacterium]|nr:D-alanyl-D-alanine carboxypeptidase/D-alanyl-D-alanine-endopeptidase [Gemmatimonadaceae bacterium]HRQ77732.1 D-alanyl-D-alanine carboxypeptidase/D-alanyl-D-alanine-endopeptidase [Gemmatimonadaceae bacterium]
MRIRRGILLAVALGLLGPMPPQLRAQGSSAAPSPTAPVARPPAPTAARRPAPSTALRATSPRGVDALRRDLARLVEVSTVRGEWGAMVVSLATGDTLFSREADELLLPASTMKLYTAALAFERFGPAHQFRTDVLRDGEIGADGTLQGNLYLRGAGDPALGARYARWNDGVPPMQSIADLVYAAGVRRISGDIVGDASAFESRRVPEGWRTRYLQSGYAARVSALSVNENIANIVVRSTAGGATVSFEEPLIDLPFHSTVTVRPGSRSAYIRVWQDTTQDRFRVHGWIGALSPERTYRVVVEQPERFAAAAFRAALQKRGIVVDGHAAAATTPPSAERLTAWASPPLAQLAVTMNGESNNHFAELLFRNAALSARGVGSAEAANEALRSFLAERAGVRRDAVYAADGSGLSTLDRVTTRSMVHLLAYAQAAPWGEVFQATLPVAGRTETLRTRMRRTAADNNLRGKTGTTNDVTSLAGYVTTQDGELLAFAFLYNGRELWRAREAIDAMGATLAAFAR